MSCFKPTKAYRRQIDGKPVGQHYFVKPVEFPTLDCAVPCGGCLGCRIDLSSEWSLRMMHEASLHEENCFLTLTYNPENEPRDGSLVKEHFQQFMKKLRKKNPGKKIRFYHAGEYGEGPGKRPHYHAIIFGHDFEDKKPYSSNEGNHLYKSKQLDKIWGKGFCTTGDVTPESCGYVARYCMKKITGDKALEHYENLIPETGEIITIQPEYSTQSNRPGIGKSWFDKFKTDIYPGDFAIVKGRKTPLPRYYDKLMEKENPEMVKEVKEKRVSNAREKKVDNTPERLEVRKECLAARLAKLQRNIDCPEMKPGFTLMPGCHKPEPLDNTQLRMLTGYQRK